MRVRRTVPPLFLFLALALSAGCAPSGQAAGAQGRLPVADEGTRQASTLSPTPTPTPMPTTTTPTPTPTPTPEPGKVTIVFAGDINFANSSARALTGSGVSDVAALTKGADLVVGNLETAITERGTPADKTYTFRAPASALDQVKAMGFDVVGVANNHGGDYGTLGMTDTIDAGRAHKLPMIGIGYTAAEAYTPYVTTINDRRIGILDATQVVDDNLMAAWTATDTQPGLAVVRDDTALVAAVKRLRPKVDTLVVVLHWGVELQECPSAAQVSIRDDLVAAGADAVVGSHAHILLGSGYHGSAYVHYGLGNFVFSPHSPRTYATGVLRLTFTGSNTIRDRWIPAHIRDGVPVRLTGSQAEQATAAQASLRSCTDLTAKQG